MVSPEGPSSRNYGHNRSLVLVHIHMFTKINLYYLYLNSVVSDLKRPLVSSLDFRQ